MHLVVKENNLVTHIILICVFDNLHRFCSFFAVVYLMFDISPRLKQEGSHTNEVNLIVLHDQNSIIPKQLQLFVLFLFFADYQDIVFIVKVLDSPDLLSFESLKVVLLNFKFEEEGGSFFVSWKEVEIASKLICKKSTCKQSITVLATTPNIIQILEEIWKLLLLIYSESFAWLYDGAMKIVVLLLGVCLIVLDED